MQSILAKVWMPLAPVVLLAALGLAGCAQVPHAIEPVQLPQDALFESSRDAGREAEQQAEHLFEMSAGMLAYADKVLQEPSVWRDRRKALIDSLYFKGGLKLVYDPGATRTASEAFESRMGNCLSLVLMTAAFAKHLELPVVYQQVLVDEEYSRSGDLYFVASHVNVMLGQQGVSARAAETHWLTIDFLPQVDLRGQRAAPLAERTVVAMFLNNRAAETLAQGDTAAAYWWARAALRHDPDFAAAANTLAVVYQRSGHLAAAERALRFVLEREPRSATAWANLASLLTLMGRHDDARLAAARLAELESHPPFFFYEQAKEALQAGRAAEARDLLKRELRRQPQQHEVHFLLAQAYAALGDGRAAVRQLALAAENSPTRQSQALYAGKLARLRATTEQ